MTEALGTRTTRGPAGGAAGSAPAVPEPAYAEILKRLEGVMRRIVPAWLADQRDDLVQAAMLRILDIVRSREQSVAFTSSYLWRVGQSVLIDEIRRRRRRPETELDAAPESRALGADPERTARSKQLAAAVRDCLGGLHETRRRVLTLHLLGHTPAETASRLGYASKKVYNLIQRGLDDLRECLRRKEVAP